MVGNGGLTLKPHGECAWHLAFNHQRFHVNQNRGRSWRVLASNETIVHSDEAFVKPTTPLPCTDWQSFSKSASGEWDGVSASFDRDGQPQQLPEYYVPEAYRDWGVKLYDWQTQCSMRTTDTGGLQYKLRRLMPTVGCEADAIAFNEEADVVFPSRSAAFSDTGSYCFAPIDINSASLQKANIEYCFALPTNKRVRVVQTLRRMGSQQRWQVSTIEVHHERYEGEYTGRRELAGCGGGMDPFATESPKLDCSELEGNWIGSGCRLVLNPGGDGQSKVSVKDKPVVISNIDKIVCLPLRVWSCADMSAEGSGLCNFTAGIWLEGCNNMLMGRVTYNDWQLQATELMQMQR